MNEYQKFYVYIHRDPRDYKVRYVGMGCGDRAWRMGNTGKTNPRYGFRSHEHFQWFKELETLGYTLDQIVFIEYRSLDKPTALRKEKEVINKYKMNNLFNDKRHERWLDKNREIITKVKRLREDKISFKKIGRSLDISTMSAWRMSNVN